MKKIFFIILLLLEVAFSRDIIAVSIPMQKEFLQSIVGEDYTIITLVKEGVNPHDFEPKASEIRALNQAVAYFYIGIEFEEVWLERFKSQNPKIQVFATDLGVEKINFAHDNHDNHRRHESHKEGDTHIWLSAKNAKIIAENLYDGIQTLNPKNDYKKAYWALLAKITSVDMELTEILKPLQSQKFVVFHPMLGYFARDYGLEEISIEVEGKSPKVKEMIAVIKEIQEENLKVIFAQPEFSTKAAEFIAKESGAQLGYFSPLKTPWAENLLEFAKTLVQFENR